MSPRRRRPNRPYRRPKRKRSPSVAVQERVGLAPGSEVDLPEQVLVQDLVNRLNLSEIDVVKQLIRNGVMANLTQVIDYDTAALVVSDFGYQPARAPEPAAEDLSAHVVLDEEDEDLEERPPVVTILGHVDHGKTTLLDAIRKADVAGGEAGGITQHIGAYQVEVNGRLITFLDTPGHEAFTAMRARGAQVTDIAVLIIAADDGVMPQTIEAIDHAKAAGVPIVVAITKTDLPTANPDRPKTQLMQREIVIEEYGGETVAVPVSGKTGDGIPDLLENILLVADLQELKANPSRLAQGVVIEAHVDHARGPVATVLVQNGILRLGDPILAGHVTGRVRALVDDRGERIDEAPPSKPVEVLGLGELAQAGDLFEAFASDKAAKEAAEQRRSNAGADFTSKGSITEDIYAEGDTQVRELPIIIKTDVQGSVEALRSSLDRLSHDQTKIRILHAAAGSINESDVLLAAASRAMIVGFNTRVEPGARTTAGESGVQIGLYTIIYEVIDDVRKALEGILEPIIREVVDGHAEVRQVFVIGRRARVAGCYVRDGKALRNAMCRVNRGGQLVVEAPVQTLRRFKDDAREVASGLECGVSVEGMTSFQEGDVIEFYHQERTAAV